MFVMATLYAGVGSTPVKIRDLSTIGALIEADVIPPEGTPISLVRGSLRVTGSVVWRKDSRAGLAFESAVTVSQWLPRAKGYVDQQRIDEMIQRAKECATCTDADSQSTTPVNTHVASAGELEDLASSLDSLADSLSQDEGAMSRYGAQLQSLDIAAQLLRKMVRPE